MIKVNLISLVVLIVNQGTTKININEKFFRKVAFGLKPDEKAPSDPLTWAQKQVETIPELNWKGKHIYSEKEMRKYWITAKS